MDALDNHLIAALRTDARRSVSDLALDLGVSRATVRARLKKLQDDGQILGFTVVTKGDREDLTIRAVTMIEVTGRSTERVIRSLSGMPEVRRLHTTNGRWDLVTEIATADLAAFDEVLKKIRLLDGISTTETSLLLSTRKTTGPTIKR